MMAIMFGEMLHFGLVLGTIMMGFTVSFFAIFGEYESYGGVSRVAKYMFLFLPECDRIYVSCTTELGSKMIRWLSYAGA